MAWVDVARGIGIILVVYGHVLRAHFPLPEGQAWAVAQDRFIYAFHMPLFFAVSGLFVWQSIARGRSRFLRSRWRQIIWPYLLWSLITATLEILFANYVNSPLTWRDMALIPVNPIEQYWFLYVLLVAQLVVAAVFPGKIVLVIVTLAGLALFANVGGGLILVRAFYYLPYVTAGILLFAPLGKLAEGPWAKPLMLAGIGWLLFAVALNASGVQPLGVAYPLLLGMLGSAGCIGLAMLLARSPLAGPLAHLGAASLAIYLVHTICSASIRIALKQLGIEPASALSIGMAVAGCLVMPLVLWRWASATGYSHLLGFGGEGRRNMAVTGSTPARGIGA